MFVRLENLVNRFLYDVLFFYPKEHLSQALNFFIYDSIKIILLLILIVNVMTFLNSYLPITKIKKFLTSKKLYWLQYILASLFGAITPFCTCSSIPLFVGFIRWGIPLWVTFSFLITSPLVNEVAVAMLLWIFGFKITAIYVTSWIVLWVFGWWLLGKLWLEKYLADFIKKDRDSQDLKINSLISSFTERLKLVWRDSWDIITKIIPYLSLGVAVGAWIHWFVPTWFFEAYITKSNPFAVPLAVILWIPMYANATSIIPIVQALIAKWIPLWTGLAFMMAVVGLSLPEFLILKKVMHVKLLFIFFGLIGFFMILLGYFFNWVL